MRKFFTCIATAAMAVVLTLSASAVNPAAKATRNQASKAPVAMTMVEKGEKVNPFANVVKTRAQAHAAYNTTLTTVKPMFGNPLKPNSMLQAPARVLGGRDVVAVCVYPSAAAGIVEYPSLNKLNGDLTTADAATIVDGVYVGTQLNNGLFGTYFIKFKYDVETWEEIEMEMIGYDGENIEEADNMALSLTTDPTSGIVYGCFYNDGGNSVCLATFNPSTLTRGTVIAEDTPVYYSMSFDNDGQLWGIDINGDLWRLDKSNGAATLAGSTGCATTYLTSGVIVNDTYYYAISEDAGDTLYAIDLATCEATILDQFDGECVGMSLIPLPADAGAPAAAENLAANFADGALSGTVEFDMPSTKFDGSALSGSCSYKVLANGEALVEGTAAAGAHVSVNVTVPAAGMYTFTVVVSNSVGDGPKSESVDMWVGADAPKASEEVVLTGDAGALVVAWDAVTESAHGGYFNAADVVYTVTRYVNGEEDAVVAENIAACTYTDTYAGNGSLAVVSYSVVASYDGVAGAPAKSNAVVLGSIVPPYENSFDDEDSLLGYTIIDANEDGRAWEYVNGQIRITYNSALDMDDYFVLPPAEFEPGKAYTFSFAVRAQSTTYLERVEVVMATEPTVEALQEGVVLIEPTDITWAADLETLECTISVAQAGKYYIAVHGVSEADKFYIYIDDVAISAPFEGVTPDVVSDVVFTAMSDGSPAADISFKAPTKKINGQDLESLTKIEVSRNGEVVKTFAAPAPGAELTFKDTAPAAGDYLYEFVAYNAEGAGKTYSKTQYLGVEYAVAPVDVVVVDSPATPGYVSISWTPVCEDINGNAIDASLITYTILDQEQMIIGENIPATNPEFGYQAVPAGQQDFVYFYVIPVTDKGLNTNAGGYAVTDMIAAGTAFDMPMTISLVGGELEYMLGVSKVAGSTLATSWKVYSACSNPSCEPADGDGGMLGWWPLSGDICELFTGKVKVNESENSAFSFYYHETDGAAYDIMPYVVVAGNKYDLLDEAISTEAEGTPEWKRVILPLVDYIGADVQLGLRCTCYNDAPYLLLDQISASEVCAYDLGVKSVTAPKGVEVGKDALIQAVISNYGMNAAGAYTVDLLCNGEVAETVSYDGLAASAAQNVIFTVSYNLFSDPEYTYQVRVNYAQDENEANNTSENIVIRVSQSFLPAVEDLEAANAEGGVQLTWSNPETGSSAQTVVDDVEDYEAFAINQAGDWTFIDVDQSNNYGFNGITFPNAFQPAAFIVFDQSVSANLEGMAYSGNKVFACFAAEHGPNDDWMISPLLPGIAQTVKFMTRAWTVEYGKEKFEFYYSTTSPAIADMIKLDTQEVGEDWVEQSFDLPEGALYFAIRCVSNDVFIFLVDDISFAVGQGELTLLGYDVYRGDVKIAENVTGTSYLDTEAPAGETVTYFVVAKYSTGESALSNPAVVEVSGIENIVLGNGNAQYYDLRGIRVNNPANGAYIRVQDGKAEKVYIKK